MIFADEFWKSVGKTDNRIRGQILNAIGELCEHPDELRGDTIKPLTANLKGMWRFRIGNHRIIYRPVVETGSVEILAFSPRSSAYGE